MINFGFAQWCMGTKDISNLENDWIPGFACIHLDMNTSRSSLWLGNPKTRDVFTKFSQKMNVKLAAIGVNTLCDYGMVNSFNSDIGRIAWSAIKTAIDSASIMKVPLVSLPSFYNGQIVTKRDLANTQYFLEKACNYASYYDVNIATENGLNAEEQVYLLNKIKAPNLWLLFDTYNPLVYKLNPLDVWIGAKQYFYPLIHVKDGSNLEMGNVALGMGDAPLRQMVKEIKSYFMNVDLIIETEYSLLNGNFQDLLRKDFETLISLWITN